MNVHFGDSIYFWYRKCNLIPIRLQKDHLISKLFNYTSLAVFKPKISLN